ncbi:MAG: hypothetical protein B7Z26_06675 [Asticcacaulis sp. 32-58-5]|nr:MAG: hypothetical protein B7Z26_06675 [Asticcacaulis sp. 32-58-5]
MLSGLASAQASAQILEHQVAGDQQLADGGWTATCEDKLGECQGHLRAEAPVPNDMLAIHHHHHNSGEVSQGLVTGAPDLRVRLNLADANLTRGDALPLVGCNPALPFQPPRA